MKKKIIAILLFVCAVFAFSACDGNDETPNTSPSDTEIGATQPEKGEPTDTEISDEKEITAMYIYINGNRLEVTLANNSSVDALVEILQQGDITYTADDYGGFEKVGNIGHTLPRNDTRIDTQAGDVILYQGNNICLYYGTNSWSFTRIGKINGYSDSELRTLLGAGNGSTQVRISLN